METIKNYLDSMFANIIMTEDVVRLKEELLANMEEKYEELIKEGKTVNEAIGTVIAEFGNIDELLEEYNLNSKKKKHSEADIREVTKDDAERFIEGKRKEGFWTGLGVCLCVVSPAPIVMLGNFNSGILNIIGVVFLLVFVAAAVGMFIVADSFIKDFKYLKKPYVMADSLIQSLEERKRMYQTPHTMSIAVGIILCILSPVFLIVSSTVFPDMEIVSGIGVAVLLCMVGAAVFLFVYSGCVEESYKKLLKKCRRK